MMWKIFNKRKSDPILDQLDKLYKLVGQVNDKVNENNLMLSHIYRNYLRAVLLPEFKDDPEISKAIKDRMEMFSKKEKE